MAGSATTGSAVAATSAAGASATSDSSSAGVALGLGLGRLAAGVGLLGGDGGFLLGRAGGGRRGLRVTAGVDEAALFDGVGDDAAHQRAGTDRVVVARDDVLDEIGVAVRVDHRDDRDAELVRLGDADVLLLRVEHEDGVGALGEVPHATEVALQLLELAAEDERFLLRHDVELARHLHALVFLHLVDALGDRLEVGEHAAQPTLVDVRHAALLGEALDRVLGLLLGADEEDRATLGHEVADERVRRLDAGQGLVQIDDVDAVAVTEDEPLHLGVPATGLVSEVHASFEQLAHRDDCSHGVVSSAVDLGSWAYA
jgi:hypothetical protein